jgi:hypothetical protein
MHAKINLIKSEIRVVPTVAMNINDFLTLLLESQPYFKGTGVFDARIKQSKLVCVKRLK